MAASHDTAVRVDHVGIAVEAIEDAEPVLRALGCERIHIEAVAGRYRWAYYRLGDASRIELIEPIDADSFLTEFLEAYGPGLHHVTLEVADIDAVIGALERADLRVVDRATHDGWTEAFVSPRNPTGALFQLMEYHDGFAADRTEELYVDGERLGEAG